MSAADFPRLLVGADLRVHAGDHVLSVFGLDLQVGDHVHAEAIGHPERPAYFLYHDADGERHGEPIGTVSPAVQGENGWIAPVAMSVVPSDLARFIKDTAGHMATNAIEGVTDLRTRQVIAAAAFVEVAQRVAPSVVPWLNALLFPDDADLDDSSAGEFLGSADAHLANGGAA